MILSAEMSKNVPQVKHTGCIADSYTLLLLLLLLLLLYYIMTSENGVVYNTKGSHPTTILLIKSQSNKTDPKLDSLHPGLKEMERGH
jgi:hypothetical protein